jgi:hypothetical protein
MHGSLRRIFNLVMVLAIMLAVSLCVSPTATAPASHVVKRKLQLEAIAKCSHGGITSECLTQLEKIGFFERGSIPAESDLGIPMGDRLNETNERNDRWCRVEIDSSKGIIRAYKVTVVPPQPCSLFD